MVCVQVHGATGLRWGFRRIAGQLELNVYKPVIIYNLSRTRVTLITDACPWLCANYMLKGIEVRSREGRLVCERKFA